MPNPVAANDLQPISGSLQTSRISYGVETAGKNYGQNYNSTTWYSDIPNNGQFYTIISDNYTANYYVSRSNAGGAYVEGGLPAVDEYSAPVFWVTVGTSSLDITTVVNGLPDRIGQTPFNSGSQALNWVASSSNYFAVGPDYYANIDADALMFAVEGNQIISYPTTGSTWYDISGYNNKATLLNGISFVSSSGVLKFDDSDDYGTFIGNGFQKDVIVSSSYASRTATFEAVVRFSQTSGVDAVITKWNNSTGETWWFGRYPTTAIHLALQTSVGYYGLFSNSTTGGNSNRFYYLAATVNGDTATFYNNGVEDGINSYSGTWNLSPSTNVNIGSQNEGTAALFGGDMSHIRVYGKSLSASEILQNYYGGPIVTDGLIYALDAGNLVSYPRTGTAWYALTGSAGTATLTNGPVFSPADGGLINFDGVDDYAITSNFPSLSNWSTEIWLNPNVYTTAQKVILDVNLGIRFEITNGFFNSHFGNGSGWIYTNLPSTTPIAANTWFHVVVTVQSGDQAKVYVNGILENSINIGSGTTPNIPLYIARFTGATGYEFNGEISAIRIYNRALTAAEVLQNYNATN